MVRTPLWHQLLLHRRPAGVLGQILDHDRPILDDHPLVERAPVLGGRVVGGIREDAGLLVPRGVAQDEHAISLDGGQAQAQVGPAEERPELRLQSLEVGARHDRVLVDQIALDRGQDLLVGDVDRLHDHEAAQDEPLRRQQRAELLTVDAARLHSLPHPVGQRRLGPDDLHVDEPPVELQPEVLIQARDGIAGGEDHHRNVASELDAVDPLEDQLVGEREPLGRHRRVHGALPQEARQALQRAVRIHERAPEGRRRVERPQMEGEEGRAVLLLPEGRREERGHHQVDERLMRADDRQVVDHPGQLGGLPGLLANQTRDRPPAELVIGGELGPERDQRGEAQLAPERERVRIRAGRTTTGGRAGHRAIHRRHAGILPAGSTPVAPCRAGISGAAYTSRSSCARRERS